MSTIATTGDPEVMMHRGVATGARAAATALPTVSAAGMRPGHAAILETALGETRKVLGELARVADVGAAGATALSEQDTENGRSYEQVKGVTR
ncbi:hypothetical protein [Mycobacteroides abscessus]|uniref:hypothetical protein n=1 Tax=Mycobacteroides abscessus TaxID=36809 RepID=UPI00092B3784|nr:hypothetical protein [Mycobacteroides abscessus]SIJ34345.1 Uncharacterised protein [Mycobacteroides abscessus subsp. abscessus]SIK92707.1 Uncharacterised protein [Mycobacteroides abscessus subsp. abscessus]SIL98368.1 Uncharacterised protein [Mycobacteroides abscessus subsp. abscessus]SLE80395.1 Uncharacterised protein [Mycobacteroides abscessus subsp. abscessus]